MLGRLPSQFPSPIHEHKLLMGVHRSCLISANQVTEEKWEMAQSHILIPISRFTARHTYGHRLARPGAGGECSGGGRV